MITFHLVNFGENATSGEIGCEIVDVRDGVGVSGGAFVQAEIVSTRASGPVLFGDHMEARAAGGIRASTDARGSHHVEILLRDLEFFGGQSPRRCLDGRPCHLDEALDSMAGRARRQRGVRDFREFSEEASERGGHVYDVDAGDFTGRRRESCGNARMD